MDAFDKVRSMLDEANAAHNEAKARGDFSTADEIEITLIDPLKSQLAGLALSQVEAHTAQLQMISEKLAQALGKLQQRIDRIFVDRLIEKARALNLAHLETSAPTDVGRAQVADGARAALSGTRRGPVQRPVGPTGSAAPSGLVIVVTDTDLDALQRVARSEVGHFGKYGEAQLRGGLAAVVDTILNRVAHPRWPDSIQEVVDQPMQFTAINDAGSWTALPAAPETIARIVQEHVEARVAGAASEIGGATHFLNPHISSASALEMWGNHVVKNAVAIYGSEEKKDVHYHGFAPGISLPPPYAVSRNGMVSSFDPNGLSPGGPVSTAQIRNELVRICREELARFNGGSAKETEDPQFLRVGDYWRAVGQPFNGRTLNADGKRPPWSSAFISFVLKEAGAGDRFKYSVAHCHYFQDFVERAGSTLYEALPTTEAIPKVGDIVHYGRGSAEQHDFAAAREAYGADSFYSSHSSIVVEVDQEKREIKTIGGNESDSVAERIYPLDANGHLKPRRTANRTLPWIGVLRLTEKCLWLDAQ